MSSIPALWGDVRHDAVTPLAVLRAQAAALSNMSGGLLEARVGTAETTNKYIHSLIVRAPALDVELDVVRLEHRRDTPYPVAVIREPVDDDSYADLGSTATDLLSVVRGLDDDGRLHAYAMEAKERLVREMKLLARRDSSQAGPAEALVIRRLANNYSELLDELRRVLSAPALVRKLTSLIALSNEPQGVHTLASENPDAEAPDSEPDEHH